jgi:hypothetical protein
LIPIPGCGGYIDPRCADADLPPPSRRR